MLIAQMLAVVFLITALYAVGGGVENVSILLFSWWNLSEKRVFTSKLNLFKKQPLKIGSC